MLLVLHWDQLQAWTLVPSPLKFVWRFRKFGRRFRSGWHCLRSPHRFLWLGLRCNHSLTFWINAAFWRCSWLIFRESTWTVGILKRWCRPFLGMARCLLHCLSGFQDHSDCWPWFLRFRLSCSFSIGWLLSLLIRFGFTSLDLKRFEWWFRLALHDQIQISFSHRKLSLATMLPVFALVSFAPEVRLTYFKVC